MQFIDCWPDGDKRLFRIINKHLEKPFKYKVIKILVTKLLPIGDFDCEEEPKIFEPKRVYKTQKGWRVFYISRVTREMNYMLDIMKKQKADPLYVYLAKSRGLYAARIDPKENIFPDNWAVTRFVEEVGERRKEWDDLIQEHDNLTKACLINSVLV